MPSETRALCRPLTDRPVAAGSSSTVERTPLSHVLPTPTSRQHTDRLTCESVLPQETVQATTLPLMNNGNDDFAVWAVLDVGKAVGQQLPGRATVCGVVTCAACSMADVHRLRLVPLSAGEQRLSSEGNRRSLCGRGLAGRAVAAGQSDGMCPGQHQPLCRERAVCVRLVAGESEQGRARRHDGRVAVYTSTLVHACMRSESCPGSVRRRQGRFLSNTFGTFQMLSYPFTDLI